MKKKSFTLLEILFSLVIFGIIFGVLFALFLRIIHTKTDIEARQTLIQNTYDLAEQFNKKMQNYTIDYEEYFDRSMVGCNNNQQGTSFSWNAGMQLGYCSQWTEYGNATPLLNGKTYVSAESQHQLYYCSSDAPTIVEESGMLVVDGGGDCVDTLYNSYKMSTSYALNGNRFFQPYGEYKTMFVDVKADVDDNPVRAGDDDDTDLGKGSIAVRDNTNVKELYLISSDKKKRLYFRRALIATGDWNQDGLIDNDNEKLYTIQMLQLQAFDAGQNHDFDALTYQGVYDGLTDTWACDYAAGFICSGAQVPGIYSGYHLPANENDGWVNIVDSNVSVSDWNLQIFPIKDPEFAWGEPQYQINPSVKLYLKTTIYGRDWAGKIGVQNLANITFDLQTTFNIKTNY